MNKLPNLQSIETDFMWRIKTTFEEELASNKQKYYPDIQATIFEQIWGSTALGFSGIGGSAMTSAYTTVIWDDILAIYAVYFNNRFAYIIKEPTQEFLTDVFEKRNIEPVSSYSKYIRKD